MEPCNQSPTSQQKTFSSLPCPASEFNYFDHASVIFYSQRSDGLYLLLFSSSATDKTLSTPNEKYDGIDAAIPFTGTRAVVTQTYGCLSPENLKKIAEGQKFTKDNLTFANEMVLPKLWEDTHYQTWIKPLTFCEIIHDEFKGKMFYFLDIAFVDTDSLNANLLELEVPLYFRWVKVDGLAQSKEYQLSEPLKEFVENVDIPAHIKEQIAYNNLPLSEKNIYVLLICKSNLVRFPEIEYFYDHLPALYMGIYRRSKETWLVYNAGQDEFPPEEVMKYAKVLTIPGSPDSAHIDDEWMVKTRLWLEKFHKEYTNTRFLGVCFGEQIICHSIGGKSDHMAERKADPKFFIRKVEDIEIAPEFYNLGFMKKNVGVIPNKLKIVEAHGDEVTEFPEGFVKYGTSVSCKVELLASKDERYFGIQSHPEFSKEYFMARRTVMVAFFAKTPLTREYFEENYRKNNEGPDADEPLSRKLCYDFVKYDPKAI